MRKRVIQGIAVNSAGVNRVHPARNEIAFAGQRRSVISEERH